MRQRSRRVFDGGTLVADFLGGTILRDVNRLDRQAEAVAEDKLSATAARSSYVRQMEQLVFDGWGMADVAAGLSNVALGRFGGLGQGGLRPAVGGSVVALGAQVSEQRTAGSLTVKVFVGGSATELTAEIDGGARWAALETPADEVLFEADEEITVRVSSSGSWAPVTADVQAWIVVNLDVA